MNVEIPDWIHESVEEYAEKHGISTSEAYRELIEFALNNIEDDEDESPRGIA